jgi:hypothetical protein
VTAEKWIADIGTKVAAVRVARSNIQGDIPGMNDTPARAPSAQSQGR